MAQGMYLVRREIGRRATVSIVDPPVDEREPRAWPFEPTLGGGALDLTLRERLPSTLCGYGYAAISFTPDHAFRLLYEIEQSNEFGEQA